MLQGTDDLQLHLRNRAQQAEREARFDTAAVHRCRYLCGILYMLRNGQTVIFNGVENAFRRFGSGVGAASRWMLLSARFASMAHAFWAARRSEQSGGLVEYSPGRSR